MAPSANKYFFLIIVLAGIFSGCVGTNPALLPPEPQPAAAAIDRADTLGAAVPTLEDAVRLSAVILAESIPSGSRMAVISIAAPESAEGEFALESLILFFVNTKNFRMADRHTLDLIRDEQNFQLSGEVDDDTAVSIGHLTGAEIVITGSIITLGQEKQLSLKALDVENGLISAMTFQRYKSFL
jgi:hypothetical protein